MNDNQGGTGRELVSDPQKAELTDIINKMKQGNPPATEGEIAKVIEDHKARWHIKMEEEAGEKKPTSILEAVAPGHDDWTSAVSEYNAVKKEEQAVEAGNYTEQTGIKKQNASFWENPLDWWKIDEDETQEENTFAEDWFGKNQLTDLFGDAGRMVENAWHGGEGLEDFLEAYNVEDASELTEEQKDNVFAALEEQAKGGVSDEMKEFLRKTNNKDTSKSFSWIDALTDGTLAENPSLIFEIAGSSFVGMGSALWNSSEARKRTAVTTAATTAGGAGIGAGIGAALTAWSGPGAAFGAAAGAVTGAVRGFTSGLFGGINGAIETGQTFGDQLRREVEAAGLEWNEENAKKVLSDPEAFERMKNKAFTKGATVQGVDMLANAIAPGAGGLVTKTVLGTGKKMAVSKLAGTATSLSIDAVGGAGGEYLSEKAIGQEADSKSLWLEAGGEFGGSGPVSVYSAIKNPPSYKINNGQTSRKDVLSFLTDENISDEEVANADIDISNDEALQKLYFDRVNKASIKAEVDPRVNEQQDVDKIVALEQELRGVSKGETQSAKSQASEIRGQIKEITDQYKPDGSKFVDARTKDVKARKKSAEAVKEGVADKVFKGNLEFAKKHSSLYGLEVDDSLTVDQIKEQYGEEAAVSDGFIKGDKIIINKTVARATGAVNVGNHELLHGILRKAVKNKDISEKVIGELKAEIGGQWSTVEQRASENYTPEYMKANPDEWITLASDAIQNGDITYNEGVFERIGNVIKPILRAAGFKKIKFDTGKDVYSFLKEYNKSIHKGALSSGIAKATKGKVEVDDIKTSMSSDQKKAAAKNVKALGENQTKKSWRRGGATAAIKAIKDNGYFDALIASKYKVKPVPRDFVDKVYSELTPHIKRFIPAEYNADGSRKMKDGKPVGNDDFFAYVNSQVSNKAGNVYNLEYKVDEAMRGSKDIDAKTSEGAPVIQVAAETDTDVTSFEEQDMSMQAQAKRTKLAEQGKSESDKYSGLRTELGLEKPMMDKVRKAVMKTFGTKLPDVNSKKFKAALQKAYRTELKKPIQDMIGKGATYDTFLTESFPTVFKFLPKETLLQMERNIDPAKRIFTKSERITKPTEVDRLISDGLLPKDTNRLSGPTLITKLPYPGSKKVMAYFRGQNMDNALGYKVGASTLGTRKDKLAMEMGVELGFDATMETVQQPEVIERRKDILELQGFDQAANDLPLIGKQINRDPNIKFSLSTLKLQNVGADVRAIFELETKGIDKQLNSFGLPNTNSLKTKADINTYVQDVIKHTLPLMPRDFWFGKPNSKGNFGTVFTGNSKIVGTSAAAKKLYQEYYVPQMKALRNLPDSSFGKPVEGVSDFSKPAYKTLFTDAQTVEKNIENGKIDEFNSKVSKIHSALWTRINDAVKKDKAAAVVIGNYLKITANDSSHWHKMGAQFVGYSPKPKLRYEYEHAMPATAAYLYLMDAALSGTDFKASYKAVIDNYKLIALDKAADKKLTAVGLQRGMPKGWSILHNTWWQRYFNELVAGENGGIDPSSITMVNGKTMSEEFSINAQGIDPAFEFAQDIDERSKDSKVMDNAIKMSRSSTKPKGITVLDFDDTLATTKSEVVVIDPNVKQKKLFNGSPKSFKQLGDRTGLVFLASEAREAEAYAKSNRGEVKEIYVNASKIGAETQLLNKIKELGYSTEDALAYELIDTRFPNSLKQSEINKVIKALKKDGLSGVEYTDGAQVVGKDTKSTVVFDKSALSETPIGSRKINAEEFAKQGGDLLAQGFEFDFSEFNKVVDGETAPLFNKAMKLYGKFGADNMFILTARAPESQLAIKQFLDAQGLKIPLKNITGLGKSEASAKANWIAEKVGEGYNDFYFADDAIQNVDAVREKLNELEVKNKVQQAKIKFSMNTKRDLNWKSTDRVTFSLEGNRVTEGKIYNASFKVGDNDYIIRLTNRPLSVNFDQGVVSGKSAFDLEFSLENQADELWDGAGKMGVEGTGRASEVLSIVSNGVMDFIKNNDVDAIGFSSADTSRTRLYNTLTKFWASRLGWEWTSQTFKPDKRTGEDFTGGKFIISNPNATKPIVEAPMVNESDFSNRSTKEKNMLSMFDIKGKAQKAKVKFSKSGPKKMSDIIDESKLDLNTILEQSKGVGKEKTFSAAKARQRGKNKGKFKFFVPPSADDFAGLMYSFMGRGKQGDKHHAWFKKNLFDPFSKGIRRHKMVQQQVANDMKNLRKAMPDVRKKLGKKVPGTEYTYEDAIRIYNWSQAGLDIPGLSQTDAAALISAVESDAKLQAFAQGVNSISNTPGGMVDPGPHWTGGNIALDLKEALDDARSTNLQQWIENKNIIFSEANMNKIEAVYGSNFREALEDSLYRMETGSTQNVGKDRLLSNFTAWIHGSIGTTMFLNARSAMLQMISNVNFVNWSDNNMLKAAGAFANQPQYWKDVSMIFNSAFLKQRRSGIQTDVNAAELLAQIKDSKNKMKAAVAHLLQLGFTPTQVADSLAIATGGATFYRNRMKTYLKEGMTKLEAETKAFEDMMEIAEETQQSTRADKISQQQASPIGKFLLAFQNTPMQYNRLIKKAAQDLVNGRGDPKANISRIVYYGAIQNLIFYGLQTALFAALFSDDEEDDITGKKTERVVNGMVDTLLRGSGIGGAVVSTVKNVIIKFMKESEKMDDGVYYTDPDWGNVVIEALNLSPPIGIKARKIYSGLKTWEYNKDVIDHMDKTDVDNPIYDAVASVTEAVTNVPLSRMYNKFQNISEALNSDHDTWKRVAMLLGWSKWSFGIKNQDVIDAKGEAKIIKAAEKKEGNRNTFVDDQKKEKDEGKKDITCAASTRSGGRCSNKVVGGGSHCTVHEKVQQNDTGKKTQCTHVKSDGKRCKVKTASKSKKCYYHD